MQRELQSHRASTKASARAAMATQTGTYGRFLGPRLQNTFPQQPHTSATRRRYFTSVMGFEELSKG
jgi:hypothetical protein